jgi:photosystem II stability/assembly factor-like uncharacterized protein
VDSRTAWRYGGRSPLYRTADGGRTWVPQLADRFGDVSGGDSPDMAIAAADGTLLVSWRGQVLRVDAEGRVRSQSPLASDAGSP